MHRGGFTAAVKDSTYTKEPGKLRICLEKTKEVLTCDEDDIEKANPPQFDRAEDLASLRHLNESSILHTLRQRYATSLIHTYGGSGNLLVVNPMAPLAIYSEKVCTIVCDYINFKTWKHLLYVNWIFQKHHKSVKLA